MLKLNMANSPSLIEAQIFKNRLKRIENAIRYMREDLEDKNKNFSDTDSFDYKFFMARLRVAKKELDKVKSQIGLANNI